MEITFTRSTRKHRVGRARVLHVIAHSTIVRVVFDRTSIDAVRFLFLGDDQTGRPLEVIALVPADHSRLLVIHVMDLRAKYRPLYERGRR